jgi:hypothetical protein
MSYAVWCCVEPPAAQQDKGDDEIQALEIFCAVFI